ncbi:MAG TPA: O-antigen ligase family protein [Solirubrobacterales bacterium]
MRVRSAPVETGGALGRAQAVAGYALPFLAVFYLAMKGGGYDAIVHEEIGVLAWWLVLLGAAVGALPVTRVTRAGWIALGLLAALALWTGFGFLWTESSERTAAELARVLTLLGVFALATLAQGRDALRRTAVGVGAAIAAVAALALLSRLRPEWFPESATGELLRSSSWRLNYPLGYWNGLAGLIAVGMPLVLWTAAHARSLVGQALAAAALPVMATAAFFTFSRGGTAAAVLAVCVLLLLHPRRVELAIAAIVPVAASVALVLAAAQRDALEDEPASALAASQADSLLVVTVIVCVLAALAQLGLATARRRGVIPPLAVPRRPALVATGIAALLFCVGALAADLPGYADDRWEQFKAGGGTGSGAERFTSESGNGRYEYWSAAVDAGRSDPLVGIGPGTFEYWWARTATVPGFVRDAHSLYLETFGELGVVGLLLLTAFLAVALGAVAVRAARRGSLERNSLLAAAAGSVAAFCFAAQFDWVWELTVIPVAVLLVVAAALGPAGESRRRETSRFQRVRLPLPARVALVGMAAVAIVLIALPLGTNAFLRESQRAAQAGDLDDALASARSAVRLQPHAATPRLQEALVLELAGEPDQALAAARAATEREPTNWRTWLVRSRLAAEANRPAEALEAFERARELNPRGRLTR